MVWDVSIILILSVVIIVVFRTLSAKSDYSELGKALSSDVRLRATYSYSASDGKAGIAIDEEKKLIYFVLRTKGNTRTNSYFFKDVISVEILQDGFSVTKTNRSSQAAGVLLGGLLLGGVGILVGGLSGGSTTKSKIKNIELVVTVNDPKNPVYNISFQNTASAEDGATARHNFSEAREWAGRMKIVMHTADQEEGQLIANDQSPAIDKIPVLLKESVPKKFLSISQELRELSALHRDGGISDTELQKRRSQLFS